MCAAAKINVKPIRIRKHKAKISRDGYLSMISLILEEYTIIKNIDIITAIIITNKISVRPIAVKIESTEKTKQRIKLPGTAKKHAKQEPQHEHQKK